MTIKKILFVLAMAVYTTVSFAQTGVDSKLSATTRIFLAEHNGKATHSSNTRQEQQLGLRRSERSGSKQNSSLLIAHPDTIDGKAYIACFLRLANTDDLTDLNNRGVIVQCKFRKGLITALVPVDSLLRVAEIANVRSVNVSQRMRPTTNKAREATNSDDILTLSADARSAGLDSIYDGTGVVLGIIDTGIDFQHIAFKDKDGNSRIKRAYVYNGRTARLYYNGSKVSGLSDDYNATKFSTSAPTTDDDSEDHGTHTASTAGGSSVMVNGSTVTVTDDHASATYGGLAPNADLYLCGINGLSTTYMANAVQYICNYADAVGKPVVVSNSWGGQYGPHDGTGDFADVTAQYFGADHPNHICLFAASNDAGNSKDGEGGGYYLTGSASRSNPLGAIMRTATYSNADAGYYYTGALANCWTRSANAGNLGVKVLVLDATNGNVLDTYTATKSSNSNESTITLSSDYYTGQSDDSWYASDATIYVEWDYMNSDKTQILLYTDGLTSTSVNQTTKNGEDYYTSSYTLAVQFYPTSGTQTLDVWGGDRTYFTNHLSSNGYTWTAGTDNSCVSDEATDPNVIAIGAYVSKNRVTDHDGSAHSLSAYPDLGDIAYFSSYQAEGAGATGEQLPWICAPGATIVSAVNAYHTSDGYMDDAMANYGMYRVNSNTTNPYGSMEGTSMATPVAAGIVALWLQAAQSVGKQLTTADVKDLMKTTAITDRWTSGDNASHFGNGKIDALAGIAKILESDSDTTVIDTLAAVVFSGDTIALQHTTATLSAEEGDIHYTTDGTEPTETSAIYSEPLEISTTTLVKAIAISGEQKSSVDSMRYVIVGTEHDGTAASPLTPAEAVAASNAGYAKAAVVRGYISSVNESDYKTKYGNLTYYIKENLADEDSFYIYRGYGVDSAKIAALADVPLHSLVTVTGNLSLYKGLAEMAKNNYMLAMLEPVEIDTTFAGYNSLYYGDRNLIVPEGMEARVYSITNGALNIDGVFMPGDILAAGTAVVVKATDATELSAKAESSTQKVYEFLPTYADGLSYTGNSLFGFDEKTMIPQEDGYVYYRVSADANGEPGFFFGSDDGSAFYSDAHRVYLKALATDANDISIYYFNGATTALSTLTSATAVDDPSYNLLGQRVNKSYRGIIIIKGKKVRK